ncbi:hypothetical protein NESM_000851000 [Novymonas esmeraldas]|uniref:Uncharacterized protein n=1 Tax=Novymonas esmeraldas TaxID=1808958 RepID=A0AAW0EYG5_9TRYP
MHQLTTFNYVAAELGHDEPVLHAVVATHRCLPPDPYGTRLATTIPHTIASDTREGADAAVDGASLSEEAAAAELTVAQELANLDERLGAWKQQRLAGLQTSGGDPAPSRVAQLEAAMEVRLTRRRTVEQDRAQQRLERIIASLGPRIETQLRLVTGQYHDQPASAAATAATEEGDTPAAAGCSGAVAAPPPSPRARILCDQQHFIARQQIALEERDARQVLLRHMWDARRMTHLAEDERSFRRRIQASEDAWWCRLFDAPTPPPTTDDP